MPLASVKCAVWIALALLAAGPQRQEPGQPPPDSPPVRLPNGKLQQDEILKEDHEKSIKDAAQLVDLAQELKADLEKEGSHVLSIADLKKTEEIEKIARRIRSRLRR